jgi:hypothetical protein
VPVFIWNSAKEDDAKIKAISRFERNVFLIETPSLAIQDQFIGSGWPIEFTVFERYARSKIQKRLSLIYSLLC